MPAAVRDSEKFAPSAVVLMASELILEIISSKFIMITRINILMLIISIVLLLVQNDTIVIIIYISQIKILRQVFKNNSVNMLIF